MKARFLRYLPYLNRQTLTVVLVLVTLVAIALAGGAPACTGSTSCTGS